LKKKCITYKKYNTPAIDETYKCENDVFKSVETHFPTLDIIFNPQNGINTSFQQGLVREPLTHLHTVRNSNLKMLHSRTTVDFGFLPLVCFHPRSRKYFAVAPHFPFLPRCQNEKR